MKASEGETKTGEERYMKKEQADLYVNSTNLKKSGTRKFHYEFLICNLLLCAFSFAFYRGTFFVAVVSLLMVLYFLITVFTVKKNMSFFSEVILLAIHMLFACVIFNLWGYGINVLSDCLVLWVFLVSIGMQILSFGLGFLWSFKKAQKFKPTKVFSESDAVAGTVAGLAYVLARILCQLLAPSKEMVANIINVLAFLIGCAGSVVVAMFIHKAYLIKKYDIQKR